MNFKQIDKKKLVYVNNARPHQLIKGFVLKDTKREQIDNEISLQIIGSQLGVSPRILHTLQDTNKFYIVMERIEGMTLADFYGDDIPEFAWKEVRRIVGLLLQNGIQYVDITPYNFMIEEKTEKIYVIDYGHAKKFSVNWFLMDFLGGSNKWNPDFA